MAKSSRKEKTAHFLMRVLITSEIMRSGEAQW